MLLGLLARDPEQRLGYAADVAAQLGELGADAGPASWNLPARPYLYRPKLSGREQVLDSVAPALARLEEGRGACVLLGGEAGSGKTRLAVTLAAMAQGVHCNILLGDCHPDGGPLACFRRPLETIADRLRELGREASDEILGPQGAILAPFAPELSLLPGQDRHGIPEPLPQEESRRRLFHAIASVFLRLAAKQPLLLILDGLQWADELTLHLLDYLLARDFFEKTPLLLLGTYRTGECSDCLSAIVAARGVTHHTIGPLNRDAVGAMVTSMLSLDPVPPDLVDFIHRRTEGNPFFVAEYLRMLVAEKSLVRDARGAWRAGRVQEYAALPVPKSIQELLGGRIGRLSIHGKGLLDTAAILGREMPGELLRLTSGFSESTFMEASEELLARNLLDEPYPGQLRFPNDQVRRQAEQSIAAARRKQLHRQAASAMEARHAPVPPEEQAALARHFAGAGNKARARRAWLAAARHARTVHALEEAERHYRAFFACDPEDNETTVDARNEFGRDVLAVKGRNREAEDQCRQALAIARRIGDRAAEARSLMNLGVVANSLGRIEEARTRQEQALGAARAAGAPRLEAVILRCLAVVVEESGERDEAARLYRQALALHRREGDRKNEGATLGNLALVFQDLGDFDKAKQMLDEALSIHRAEGSRRAEAITLVNQGNLAQERGNMKQARLLYEEAGAIIQKVGDRKTQGAIAACLAAVCHHLGDFAMAAEQFDRALTIAREIESIWLESVTLTNFALLRLSEGRLDESLDLYRQALPLQEQISDRRGIAINLSNQAIIYHQRGETTKARTMLYQVLDQQRDLKDIQSEASTLANLANMARDQGDIDEARKHLSKAIAIARETGDRRAEGMFLTFAATSARLVDGDFDQAESCIRQAEELLAEAGDVPELVKCACESGHIALARNESATLDLRNAEEMLRDAGLPKSGEAGQALMRLRHAAKHAGKPLLRGERPEDVAKGLRDWIDSSRQEVRNGMADPPAS